MDEIRESPVITNRSSPYLSVAQLSIALPLFTAPLNCKQKVESHRPSEGNRQSIQNSQEVSSPKAATGLSVSNLEITLAHMAQAAIQNQTHLRPYTVTREYELFGRKRDKARSRVIANMTFRPPDTKDYRIKGSEGSALGEKIVRLILEREAVLAKDGGASDISKHNYSFQFLREEFAGDRRCYVLQLLPKRQDKILLRGTIWVDATTYVICRIEGQPATSPSWWVRDIHIVLVYGNVSGMWLPKSSECTARVRLLGPSRMVERDLNYSYTQSAKDGHGPGWKPQTDDEYRKVVMGRPAGTRLRTHGLATTPEHNTGSRADTD